MARNSVFSATTGAKTALNLIAGANQNVALVEWGISFDGTTYNQAPGTVELCTSTQATAGTSAGSAPAIVQVTGRAITVQSTVGHNYTSEPTVLVPIEQHYIPSFMGTFVKQYPLGQEPSSDLSGGTIKALALRVNTTNTVNCLAYFRFTIGG